MFFDCRASLNTKLKRNSRILTVKGLGEKPNEGVNNNTLEPDGLRSMLPHLQMQLKFMLN